MIGATRKLLVRWILTSLSLASLVACGKSSERVEGETHWLERCDEDATCSAGLSCLCGVCTRACTSDSSCGGLGDSAVCAGVADADLSLNCGVGDPEQVCVAAGSGGGTGGTSSSGTGGTSSGGSTQGASTNSGGGSGASNTASSSGGSSAGGSTSQTSSGGSSSGGATTTSSGGSNNTGGSSGAGGAGTACDGGIGCVLNCDEDGCECQCPTPAGTCGGLFCAEGMVCCGPPDCGYCMDPDTDPACANSCPARACGDEGLTCLDPNLGFPGQICLIKEVVNGPTTETQYRCERRSTCSEPLSCSESCVGLLCTQPNEFPVLVCQDASDDPAEVYCRGGNP